MLSYSDAIAFMSFEQRFNYLKLNGIVAHSTFGGHRWINQALYQSEEWKRTRRKIILRDNGCDLAIPDRPIRGRVLVHHLNPITAEQIANRDPAIFDPDNLITVSFETHNAIHYGDENQIIGAVIERSPNDTIPWK